MRRRARARAERRSEQERSSLRRSSAPLYQARAAESATLHDNVWFFLHLNIYFFHTVVLLVRRASSARASEQCDLGAVSGGNGATTGASGRCRDATTDSSESGARVRASAELVAPQFSSLLSSSCRQERDAAQQRVFSTRCTFFFVTINIILMVRRASSARASEQGNFGSERGR